MSLYVDTGSVENAASVLRSASQTLLSSGIIGHISGVGAYSQVSGLDHAGSMHADISSINEPEATKALAELLKNAADILQFNSAAFQDMDMLNAVGFDKVDGGAARAQTQGNIDSLTVAKPTTCLFVCLTPSAGRPLSLETLFSQLIATDVGSMTGISENWLSTATSVEEAVSAIPQALSLLASSAETPAIQRAMTHLSSVQTAGSGYATNAGILAAHTADLVLVTESNAVQTAAALAVKRASGSPALAKVYEDTFLETFSPKLTAELVPVTPGFSQLLPSLDSPSGGASGVTAPDVQAGRAFESIPLPKVMQDAFADAGYGELARATTPAEVISQVGRPNPDMLQSIAAGATPTQAASAAAPSLPPLPAGAGASLPGSMAAPAGAGMTGGGTGLAVAPMGNAGRAGTGPVGAAAGLGGGPFAGTRAGLGAGAGSARATGALGRMGAGGFGAGGFGAGAGAGGLGAGSGAGSGGFGAGAGAGAGGFGPGMGAGSGAGAGAGVGGAGSNTFIGGQGNQAARGGAAGVPAGYGGGAHRGQKGKKGKVQAVTSAVEREGNLKALLGEAPEVVPGVIGAWVREPRR